jgi:hypothetical protein
VGHGSLLVVGTGIAAVGQITLEARRAIEGSDSVLYLSTDPLTREFIEDLNPVAVSLDGFYEAGRDRALTYAAIAQEIAREVRRATRVCAVFEGHPGVFVEASHAAIELVRAEGHRARMLPGVCALDCLAADLGFDPGPWGCQSYEATDFLLYPRPFDDTTPLVLWQIGSVGVFDVPARPDHVRRGLGALSDVLARGYGPEHRATIYEAALLGICTPRLEGVRLGDLPAAAVSSVSTLFVPPARAPELSRDMAHRLGIDLSEAARVEEEAMHLLGGEVIRGQTPAGAR